MASRVPAALLKLRLPLRLRRQGAPYKTNFCA